MKLLIVTFLIFGPFSTHAAGNSASTGRDVRSTVDESPTSMDDHSRSPLQRADIERYQRSERTPKTRTSKSRPAPEDSRGPGVGTDNFTDSETGVRQ